MDSDIQNIIKAQVAKMPQSVRDALKEIRFTEQIRTVAQKNGLRIDQAGVVEAETMLTLLGLEHPDAFVKNLSKDGSLSSAQAEIVARDVNETIFKNIKHALVEMSAGNEIPKAVPPPAPAAVTAPFVPPTPAVQQGISRVMPNDIAKTKLEQSFRLPPETATVTIPPTSLRGAIPPSAPSRPQGGLDPYREPIQ